MRLESIVYYLPHGNWGDTKFYVCVYICLSVCDVSPLKLLNRFRWSFARGWRSQTLHLAFWWWYPGASQSICGWIILSLLESLWKSFKVGSDPESHWIMEI